MKKNTALILARMETGLEENADTTKYMVMSQDQSAGRSHNMKTDKDPLKGWKSSNVWEQP